MKINFLPAGGLQKIGLFIVLSPVIGFMLGYFFLIATTWLFRKVVEYTQTGRKFIYFQT